MNELKVGQLVGENVPCLLEGVVQGEGKKAVSEC